jgi:hypothetical protein
MTTWAILSSIVRMTNTRYSRENQIGLRSIADTRSGFGKDRRLVLRRKERTIIMTAGFTDCRIGRQSVNRIDWFLGHVPMLAKQLSGAPILVGDKSSVPAIPKIAKHSLESVLPDAALLADYGHVRSPVVGVAK